MPLMYLRDMATNNGFSIRFVNHGYSVPADSFESARIRIMGAGFDATIERCGRVLASWSILAGWTYYDSLRTTIEMPTPTDAELLAEYDAR